MQQLMNQPCIFEHDLVEENGVTLSGGEVKKICLIRSLIKKAGFYVFDESLIILMFLQKKN